MAFFSSLDEAINALASIEDNPNQYAKKHTKVLSNNKKKSTNVDI
jgi:hypothetical protein